MKKLLLLLLMLPIFASAQIALNRQDTSLLVLFNGNPIKWKSEIWTNNKFIDWGSASMFPSAGKVPIFSEQGLLSTGMPLFPENAVPLFYLDARLNGVIEGLRIGQAGGVATLGQDGKIPTSFLNISGLNFKGAWNPNTNTPNLINGTGNVGDFYKASNAGTFNFGNGEYTFNAGDWVIFAAGVWQRLGSNELVYSVNGKIGEVVLSHLDVGALPNTYVPQWSALTGKPSSSSISIDDAVTKRHAHDNKSALDLITESGGNISYNGSQLMRFPLSNNSVPIRDNTGGHSSIIHTPSATASTMVSRNAAGTFSATTPTETTHVATKEYVDENASAMPTTSTVNGWKIREYVDRIEYSRRVSFSFVIGTGGNRYYTLNTNINSPTGINLSNADEHYISLNSSNRTADLCVYQQDGTGTFRIGGFNNYHASASITATGDFYVKLIRYK